MAKVWRAVCVIGLVLKGVPMSNVRHAVNVRVTPKQAEKLVALYGQTFSHNVAEVMRIVYAEHVNGNSDPLKHAVDLAKETRPGKDSPEGVKNAKWRNKIFRLDDELHDQWTVLAGAYDLKPADIARGCVVALTGINPAHSGQKENEAAA